MRSALAVLDHFIWVTADLEAGVAEIESRLGVRAVMGGQHPGRGTHNAILGLGDGIYLEILAPDSRQSAPRKPRWLGVDDVGPARLSTWAAKEPDVAGAVAAAARAGVRMGTAIAGGRRTPDGAQLMWTVSDPDTVLGDGVVPFLIDWADTPHPSVSAPAGARLVSFRAEHPDAERVRTQLTTLGIDLDVRMSPVPALIATIATARGEVELR